MGKKKTVKRLKVRLTQVEAKLADIEEQFQTILAALAHTGQVEIVEYDTKDSN